ncbi:hypothetical protein MSG28_006851 [Choristoneura fumiferana]|uniref:Uncharacterized protein n=1 Tax=Choristoneura fumiferana TaxID=7141 RepID=A0ACC0JLD5_CHOFU|nr:hypothetical protein MSG28_006851 [Choristoneura fumiferana]
MVIHSSGAASRNCSATEPSPPTAALYISTARGENVGSGRRVVATWGRMVESIVMLVTVHRRDFAKNAIVSLSLAMASLIVQSPAPISDTTRKNGQGGVKAAFAENVYTASESASGSANYQDGKGQNKRCTRVVAVEVMDSALFTMGLKRSLAQEQTITLPVLFSYKTEKDFILKVPFHRRKVGRTGVQTKFEYHLTIYLSDDISVQLDKMNRDNIIDICYVRQQERKRDWRDRRCRDRHKRIVASSVFTSCYMHSVFKGRPGRQLTEADFHNRSFAYTLPRDL